VGPNRSAVSASVLCYSLCDIHNFLVAILGYSMGRSPGAIMDNNLFDCEVSMPRDSVAIGKKAAETIKKRHGEDFYKVNGSKGGKSRKKPYYHFRHLQQTDPEALKLLGKRTAKGYDNNSKLKQE
jgi:hypothetical protein